MQVVVEKKACAALGKFVLNVHLLIWKDVKELYLNALPQVHPELSLQPNIDVDYVST